MRRLSGETDQRATHRHSCGGKARLVEGLGDLGERTPQAAAQDDGIAIRMRQPLKGRFVALERFEADPRSFEQQGSDEAFSESRGNGGSRARRFYRAPGRQSLTDVGLEAPLR